MEQHQPNLEKLDVAQRRRKKGEFFLCLTTKFAKFALHQSTYNLFEYHLTKSIVWYICVGSNETIWRYYKYFGEYKKFAW